MHYTTGILSLVKEKTGFLHARTAFHLIQEREYNIEIEDPFVKGKWIFSRFNFSFMSYIYLCILSMVIHSIVHFLKHKTYDPSKFETATPTIVHLKIKISDICTKFDSSHCMKLFVELLHKSI